ncbi:hypothetical protein [Acidocella sp.]|uniref:hypothetical protein n=1 Tax=Acidocella sp. TaxID=50710 RepID=UPI0026031F3D|nr:hypothetical protein [Acidocella sp.]
MRWLIFCFSLCCTGLAGATPAAADTTSENLSLELQKALPRLLSQNDVLQAVFDSGIIQSAPQIHSSLPPPDAELRHEIITDVLYNDDPDPMARLRYRWFPKLKFGGVFGINGSEEFEVWAIFTAGKHFSHLAPMSPILRIGTCEGCAQELDLGLYDGRPTAIMVSGGPGTNGQARGQMTVAVQDWNGTSWSEPSAFKAGYISPMNRKPIFLACAGVNCDNAARLGFTIASHFYQNPAIPPSPITLSPAQTKQFDVMAERAELGTFDAPGPTDILPSFGGRSAWPQMFVGFDASSEIFPAELDGVLLLGRIGHGTMGWRVDSQWNIGFWRLDSVYNTLVPVAAMVFSTGTPAVTSIRETTEWSPGPHS